MGSTSLAARSVRRSSSLNWHGATHSAHPAASDCDWARPCHICTGTRTARPCHICSGTGLTPATSAPGLGSIPVAAGRSGAPAAASLVLSAVDGRICRTRGLHRSASVRHEAARARHASRKRQQTPCTASKQSPCRCLPAIPNFSAMCARISQLRPTRRPYAPSACAHLPARAHSPFTCETTR